MKKNLTQNTVPFRAGEDDIRDYAYHLYVQSGSVPGRDLDNWLEAQACLSAFIPQSQSNARLHHHLQRSRGKAAAA
jgi:hypothetical protein